jgi:hypothetical protein
MTFPGRSRPAVVTVTAAAGHDQDDMAWAHPRGLAAIR